jgi:protein-disulfide isomerase
MKRDLAAGLLALVGLVLSTALLVDSVAPAPAFCAEGGCAAVRATGWATPLGVPLPAVGIGFFALALGLGAAGPAAHRARRLLAIGGGLAALGLLVLQGLVIGAWCQLCVVVDVTAVLHAIAVATARPSPRAGRARLAVTVAFAAAAIGLPLTRVAAPAGPMAVASGLPEVVAREQVPGTAVVVDFIDFECRFCRAFHARLGAALAEVDVPVRVVRKMVPLPMHRGAVPAALAWCCADDQGKGDQMADALFAAPTSELTPDGIQRIADALGVDLAEVDSPAIRARVERDLAAAEAAHIRSLPTVYIGDRAFVGAGASVAEIALALRRASS